MVQTRASLKLKRASACNGLLVLNDDCLDVVLCQLVQGERGGSCFRQLATISKVCKRLKRSARALRPAPDRPWPTLRVQMAEGGRARVAAMWPGWRFRFVVDPRQVSYVKEVETGLHARPNGDCISCIQYIVEVGEWLVTGTGDGTFKVWEQQDWTCVKTVRHEDPRSVCAEAMDECGGNLIIAPGATIEVWEPGSWTCTRRLRGHGESVRTGGLLSFGGKLLSCCYGGEVRVWETTDWRCERVLRLGFDLVRMAAHDDKLYCSLDNEEVGATIVVFSTADWAITDAMCVPIPNCAEELLTWNGRLVGRLEDWSSDGSDSTIMLFGTGGERGPVPTAEQSVTIRHTKRHLRLRVCADTLVSYRGHPGMRVWVRTEAGLECDHEVLHFHQGKTTHWRSLACLRDERTIVTATMDGTMFVWR